MAPGYHHGDPDAGEGPEEHPGARHCGEDAGAGAAAGDGGDGLGVGREPVRCRGLGVRG